MRGIEWTFYGLGCALFAAAFGLTLASDAFGYDQTVEEMPVLWLSAGLVIAGSTIFPLRYIVQRSAALPPVSQQRMYSFMVIAAIAMRAVLLPSTPALEDDYQRYLWDGAITANGLNPYEWPPDVAKHADPARTTLGRLAVESGDVLGRVNHPELRTIYPPVAQTVFAITHLFAPWNLAAWRAVILIFELAALLMLVALLRDLGHSPLWASLYAWNPVVLKELYNSAHMEAILLPLLLATILFAIRKRTVASTLSLTIAAGIKVWPLVLLPVIWRCWHIPPRELAVSAMLAAIGCALFVWPVVAAGLGPSSGFVAYATSWETNSLLFPLVSDLTGDQAARILVLVAVAGVIAWQSRTRTEDAQAVMDKVFISVAAVFMLSPAQFPWYYLWLLPLLACRPVPGFLVLSATLPLYYTAFHFHARGDYEGFTGTVIWFIWTPVLAMLAWDAYRHGYSLHSFWSSPGRNKVT